jgi:hypothetical protein
MSSTSVKCIWINIQQIEDWNDYSGKKMLETDEIKHLVWKVDSKDDTEKGNDNVTTKQYMCFKK